MWPVAVLPFFATEPGASGGRPESNAGVNQDGVGSSVHTNSNTHDSSHHPVDKVDNGTNKDIESLSQSSTQSRSISEGDKTLQTTMTDLGPPDINTHSIGADTTKELSSSSSLSSSSDSKSAPLLTPSPPPSPPLSPPPSLSPAPLPSPSPEEQMSSSVTPTPQAALDPSEHDLGVPNESDKSSMTGTPPSALGDLEIKTEEVSSHQTDPPLPSTSPPLPSPSNTPLDQFQEKPDTSERDGNMVTPDRGGGGGGGEDGESVGEQKHSANGALSPESDKGDSVSFSQETSEGVKRDPFVVETAIKEEDKHSSSINNTSGPTNVSINGDIATQETLARDLNGNTSTAQNGGNGFVSVSVTFSTSDIPLSTPLASGGEPLASQAGQDSNDSPDIKGELGSLGPDASVGSDLGIVGHDKVVGRENEEGVTSGVVTGVGGGGGGGGEHTGGDVTAGVTGGGALVSGAGDKGGGLSTGVAGGQASTANGSNGGGGGGGQVREKSVFVRLSNRINFLEGNISLFTSYLDQISTR